MFHVQDKRRLSLVLATPPRVSDNGRVELEWGRRSFMNQGWRCCARGWLALGDFTLERRDQLLLTLLAF